MKINLTSTAKWLLLTIALFLSHYAQSQVTIGSGKSPVAGSLLDLKEYDITDPESINGSTASKGFTLPRVRLVDSDKLFPMFDSMPNATTYQKGGVNYPKTDQDQRHIGLLVYNLTIDPTKGLTEGIYYWNGTTWSRSLGPWNELGTNKPAIANTANSYLQGKAVVGGTSMLNNSTLSVHGTTTISDAASPTSNPSAILDIQSSNKGILIPRIFLTSREDNSTIQSPAKGLMVYNTNTGMLKGEGFYINYGNETDPSWVGFVNNLPDEENNYQFSGFQSTIANSVATADVSANSTINSLELGMELTITLPPMSENQISVNYSVPAGQRQQSTTAALIGYLGIRFMKKIGNANYEESQDGSRKYSVVKAGDGAFFMVSISATTVETVINSTNAPLVVKYKLYGYVETGQSQTMYLTFNRWANTGPNYNWGVSTMTSQTFTRAYIP